MRLVLVVTLVLCAAACRQADGPMPTPSADQNNEIGDIARDMVNVVNKDPQAAEDLRSDLSKYGTDAEETAQIDALAQEMAKVLDGARLDDQTAQRLASTLWITVTAKQLSTRQVDGLGREVKNALASAGVAEDRAQPIANRLGDVQRVITDNPKRWYQVF